ncbi:penicillin-binding protein activator [uncultured Massilia sp.]|uniref:penicillin-binding protein activator n=1 Tax=uncultured Massilia sp. TaxID=169973 RepID=UPI0025EB706F|nr:penicillin-binding protein activator [uncultured Massilia sp.]
MDEIPAGGRAVPAPVPVPAAPVRPAAPQPDPADTVRTAPIQLFDRDAPAPAPDTPSASALPAGNAAPAGGVTRIALLLPMDSPSLGGAADAVRAGFMAGAERDGSGFQVELVPTGDSPEDTLAAYARAAASHDIVVGPLARPAVTALVDGGTVSKPTIVLNHPEQRGAIPPGILVAGLSLEAEAAQVADWAAREHPQGRALILVGNSTWSQRSSGAFEARWNALGRTSQRFAVPSAGGRVEPSTIDSLRDRLEVDPPDLLFAALDVIELRQLAAHDGAQACTAIPCYGGSSINPGRTPGVGAPELNGVRVVDIPWLVQPDNSAVMSYPRPDESARPLYMSRLYALGIDAFRVAREVALRPAAPFTIDGVTGRLRTDGAGLQRSEAAAVYRDGDFRPADSGG